jgi:hypothetical protein
VKADDRVRLNYADTYFGKSRQTQAAKLFDGLQASGWLTDVLSRIADHKINRIDELLPWRYAASAA